MNGLSVATQVCLPVEFRDSLGCSGECRCLPGCVYLGVFLSVKVFNRGYLPLGVLNCGDVLGYGWLGL